MKCVALILASLVALVASQAKRELCIDEEAGLMACMGQDRYELMDQITGRCFDETRPKDDNQGPADRLVTTVVTREDSDEFSLVGFIRGYAAQKVCMFEMLGWCNDDGSINDDMVKEFMGETKVSNFFEGEQGTRVFDECHRESDEVGINDFFVGLEPNNEVECENDDCPYCNGECNCEGECTCEDCSGNSMESEEEDSDESEETKPAKAAKKGKIAKALFKKAKGLFGFRNKFSNVQDRYDFMSFLKDVRKEINTHVEKMKPHFNSMFDNINDDLKELADSIKKDMKDDSTSEEDEEEETVNEEAEEEEDEEDQEDEKNNESEKQKRRRRRRQRQRNSEDATDRFGLRDIIEGNQKALKEIHEKIEKHSPEMSKLMQKIHDKIHENMEESDESDESGEKGTKKAHKHKLHGKGKHSHIHVPKLGKDNTVEDEDIDIVEEFVKCNDDEQAEVMLLLKPITFFRCMKTYFDGVCMVTNQDAIYKQVVADSEEYDNQA